MSHDRFVTATGRAGLTRAYDRILALTMREARWRGPLLDAIARDLPRSGRVLDVGAGTGTLARQRPDAEVLAIDGDDGALDLARAKPGAGRVRWERVLRPGGVLHVADWGRPHDPLMRAAFAALQVVDGFAGTRDHAAGRLPGVIRAAGFAEPGRYVRLRTAWGSLELLRVTAAPPPSAARSPLRS